MDNMASTVGQSSNSDLVGRKLASEDLFGVCECGTCTVDSFLQNGCPRPSQVPALSMPFMDLSHLDVSKRQILLGRLYLEYKAILSKFGRLKKEVQRYVTTKKITVTNLGKILTKLDSFLPTFTQDNKALEVKKLKTVGKLLGAILPDDSSFLEYQVLEDLASELKSSDLKSSANAYKKDLEEYSRRGIFQCPSYSPANKSNSSNFIVEMDKNYVGLTIARLLAIRDQLCGVLGVPPLSFSPCSVSKIQASGHVQVIFRVSNFVKDLLSPLNAEKEGALRQIGLLGGSFYNGMDPMAADPVSVCLSVW